MSEATATDTDNMAKAVRASEKRKMKSIVSLMHFRKYTDDLDLFEASSDLFDLYIDWLDHRYGKGTGEELATEVLDDLDASAIAYAKIKERF